MILPIKKMLLSRLFRDLIIDLVFEEILPKALNQTVTDYGNDFSEGDSEKVKKNINYLKGNMFGNEGTLCDLENEKYFKNLKDQQQEAYDQIEDDDLETLNALEEKD